MVNPITFYKGSNNQTFQVVTFKDLTGYTVTCTVRKLEGSTVEGDSRTPAVAVNDAPTGTLTVTLTAAETAEVGEYVLQFKGVIAVGAFVWYSPLYTFYVESVLV